MKSGFLSAEKIKSYLKNPFEVLVFDSLNSTNTELKKMAANGAKEGTLVLAHRQAEGRGRLGRSFHSPESGLYLSLLLKPESKPENALQITVAAAAAVALAIEKLYGIHCDIKWVNDIFLNGKKICGILTEGAIKNNLLEYAVLGIGLNLTEPEGGFPAEIMDIAGALFENETDINSANRLVAEIINIFFDFYKNLPQKSYLSEYRRRCMLMGKDITYKIGSVTHTATVKGIDDNAGLIIEESGKTKTLSAGEVSVRITK